MTYGPPPEYPRATSSPTIILLASGLTGALGFLIGFFAGFGSGDTSAAPAPRVTVTVEESAEPGASPSPYDATGTAPAALPPSTAPATAQVTPPGTAQTTAPATAQVTAPAITAPGGTTAVTGPPGGGRTMVVGVDIQPGTYRTAGPAAGQPMCYWARLKATVPRSADIIAADMPKSAATVTIAPTDKAFQTGGCADWIKV